MISHSLYVKYFILWKYDAQIISFAVLLNKHETILFDFSNIRQYTV
jgi:hypothetical protein